MSARNSQLRMFGPRSGSGKAAGAVIACAVLLLAGCGGSGGTTADAGAPIIRGATTFRISNTPTTFAVDTTIIVTTSGGTTGRNKEVTTKGVCAREGTAVSTAVKATRAGECIVTMTQRAATGDATDFTMTPLMETATATFTFTAAPALTADAPALTADAPALTVSGTPTNPIAGETVTLTTAGGSGSGDVSYTVQPLTPVCTVTNSALTRPQHGTCVVTATQGGSTGTASFVFGSGIFFVKFDANGGSGSIARQYASTATALTANNGAIQRTGYTFDGWATLPKGAQAYADGASYPFTDDAMLFARWVAVTPVYTVSFDANGGDESIASQSATGPTLLTANNGAIKRTGFTFDGWATSASGTKAYANGAPYPFTANATLYARWVCKPFTVTATARRQTTGSVVVRYTSTSEVPMTTLTANNSPFSGFTKSITRSENGGQIIVNLLDPKKLYSWTMTGTNTAGCSATSQPTTPNV
jgi:uncharacterized repeat protein (TIGR02543 family)